MYRELYELLNKQGRVKRAIFLDGIYKGEFMTEHHREGDFWYPYLKEIEKIEETKQRKDIPKEPFVQEFLTQKKVVFLWKFWKRIRIL